VRVRVIELRILGVLLVALWFAAFALVVLGYRPGGPVDLAVGLAAAGPIWIAFIAVVWPPVARGDRAFAAIAWLGLGAVLLLVPSLASLVAQLTGRGPQTLLPSAEAAYPWVLALVATSLFAGLGLARRRLGETALRRPRLVLGTTLGALFVVLAGTLFTVAAVANELALFDRPAIASRFGPTDPSIEPPPCDGPLQPGSTAKLELQMDAAVDNRRTGQVEIEGIRNGADIRWSGFAATPYALGQRGVALVGERAWVQAADLPWTSVPIERATGRDLDRQIVIVALSPANRVVAEDRGLAWIEGAPARHCRVTLDGATLRRALPELELLIGDADLSRWRADVDFWVFTDTELGQVDVELHGPATGLEENALTATVRARLTAVDRGLPISVFPPTP
jgi:hypothetical protein